MTDEQSSSYKIARVEGTVASNQIIEKTSKYHEENNVVGEKSHNFLNVNNANYKTKRQITRDGYQLYNSFRKIIRNNFSHI